MANIVEVIIQGKDETGAAFNNSTQGAEKLGRAIENGPNVSLRSLRRAALVAIAALYGLERGLEAIVGRAKELGMTNVSDAFDRLKAAAQAVGDNILTISFAGTNMGAILQYAFGNLTEEIKGVNAFITLDIGLLELARLAALRLAGSIAEAMGFGTPWTQAWYDQSVALEKATMATRIQEIATGTLTDAIKQQNGVLLEGQHNLADWNKGQRANVKTLEDMIKATQQLNDQYSKRKSMEDAIRAGDARALADAMYGGGGSGGNADFRGTGRSGGGRSGGPGSNNKGDNINVYVSVGGRDIRPMVRKEIVKSVFGQTGKSDASRFPGKDQ